MTENTQENPFLALFGQPAKSEEQSFNEGAEVVFRLTLRPNRPKKEGLHYMKDLAAALDQENFDSTALSQAVLDYCVTLSDYPVLDYLFSCYERSLLLKVGPTTSSFQENILSNVFLLLSQPELFPEQDGTSQWMDLLSRPIPDVLKGFLDRFVSFCQTQEESPSLEELFQPIFNAIQRQLKEQHLMLGSRTALDAVLTLSGCPPLAAILVSSSFVPENSPGREWENTLLGALFVCSCIPSSSAGPSISSDFFDRPSRSPASVHSVTETNIWTASQALMERVYKIFYTLLKAGQNVQDLTRTWIGQVLTRNRVRGQTWHSHQQHLAVLNRSTCVSDGFMLNLSAVLLQLCRPFCSLTDAKAVDRLAKIDPFFSVRAEEKGQHQIRLKDLHKETCFVTVPENNRPDPPESFTFSTELFYFTHKAIELGAKVVHDQLLHTSQDLGKLQRAYQDAQQSGQTAVAEQIQERMDRLMTSYLCFKAMLLVPDWLDLQFEFLVSTSKWLCWQAAKNDPGVLSCIPEFCLGNIMDFVVFAHRFSPGRLERGQLDDFLDLVVTYMGSPARLKNPHLRAAMAEMLDCLMPPDRGALPASSNPRDALFIQHPRAAEVPAALLHVFASIETTGQGVAFEQKFNYRRPMYAAMKYLWGLPVHRRQFKVLAREAEEHMEDANPPLFLQFVNLLINDAIYLLDEGLSYMAQLKEQQVQRGPDGSWPDLQPATQRAQREGTYQHTVMLARFHNMMGRETIRILDLMTAGIRAVFVHPTMVDRVAGMLNYFLLHLVGPKKRDFKVSGGDYEFDPAELVSCICRIYIHLSPVETFCTAVFSDGRSYSPQLFPLAENVLARTGRGSLISDWTLAAERIARVRSIQQDNDFGPTDGGDQDDDIPDEFLDPIMSTIMMNPVILPSSRVTVDRSTIARHLLSDQSDPFNRSPLTMQDVVPDEDLRKRIHCWLEERKKRRKDQQSEGVETDG